MTSDEQARQRLVEIAREAAATPMRHIGACRGECVVEPVCVAYAARQRAGFREPKSGSWCAAGLAAAMEDAGLLIPAPGTLARRGAIALLEWVANHSDYALSNHSDYALSQYLDTAVPGDIIAWLQHPPPDPAGWRRGHVAVIVAVDDESITTVGWNEGPAPGRVMMRRLWRDSEAVTPYHHDRPRPAETVLWRRPGGLYGIARPVAA